MTTTSGTAPSRRRPRAAVPSLSREEAASQRDALLQKLRREVDTHAALQETLQQALSLHLVTTGHFRDPGAAFASFESLLVVAPSGGASAPVATIKVKLVLNRAAMASAHSVHTADFEEGPFQALHLKRAGYSPKDTIELDIPVPPSGDSPMPLLSYAVEQYRSTAAVVKQTAALDVSDVVAEEQRKGTATGKTFSDLAALEQRVETLRQELAELEETLSERRSAAHRLKTLLERDAAQKKSPLRKRLDELRAQLALA